MISQSILTLIGKYLPRWVYATWLKETHINRTLKLLSHNETYLEIGVRDGTCFRWINAPRKIGVDPARQKFGNEKPGETFYEIESDIFFKEHASQLFSQQPINVALADGLHEFAQTLRDIFNIERHIASDGVIFIHDCNPALEIHAGPEIPGTIWNGDVWKIGPYLQKYRPDLNFFTLDCTFGLGVITGFNSSAPPHIPTKEAIAECANLTYSYLRDNRKQVLNLKSPLQSFFSLKSMLIKHSKSL